jgi:hypothetical protein
MNKKTIIIGLGLIAVAMAYIFYSIRKNNTTEFSTIDAEYDELLRQYLVLKGLPNTAVNRLKYGNMKKEELENALGY